MIGEVIHEVLSLFLRHHLASDRKKLRCFDDADRDDSSHSKIINQDVESIDPVVGEISYDRSAKPVGDPDVECDDQGRYCLLLGIDPTSLLRWLRPRRREIDAVDLVFEQRETQAQIVVRHFRLAR